MDSRKPLTEVLPTVYAWHKRDGAYLASHSFFSVPANAPSYSWDEFNAIDYRLVHVLIASGDSSSGTRLMESLYYWQNPVITLPVYDLGLNKLLDHQIARNFIVFEWDTTSSVIDVLFTKYTLATTNSGISYVNRREDAALAIPRTWLDETYPGWDTKYLLAQSLEMDAADMTRLIVDKTTPAGQPTLTGLEFD